MKKCLYACLLLAATVTPRAFAAGTAVGKPYDPYFMPDGTVIVYVNGSRDNAPGCATYLYRFIFDATTAAGKVQLTGMLMALATGKTISVVGTGNCLQSSEIISYFLIDD